MVIAAIDGRGGPTGHRCMITCMNTRMNTDA
jgi:hypothetical protein